MQAKIILKNNMNLVISIVYLPFYLFIYFVQQRLINKIRKMKTIIHYGRQELIKYIIFSHYIVGYKNIQSNLVVF